MGEVIQFPTSRIVRRAPPLPKLTELQEKDKVTCIPTVIIFESGEEKERFKANIMFQLDADKKIVQNSINNLVLNKFQ